LGRKITLMSSDNHVIRPKRTALQFDCERLSKTHLFMLLIVLAISSGYMATHLKRGWVPHDEGTLGQSAERVLNGELPHRDFDDYTGGLTFVHALAFREFGISSTSMRIVLFVFFVFWVPAVFYVASRFGSAYSAGAVTLLAVAWSVPNYPAPMPSWYNLFFATFGVAAILRHLESGSRLWLFLAGFSGGLSFLAKITSAYFIAGALLFFIFREQIITRDKNPHVAERARLYSAAVSLSLTVFLMLLFRMIHKVPGVPGLIFFVLPVFFLVALLLAREFAGVAGQSAARFVALMRMCLPFGVGVALPLIVFVIPYVLTGSVHDLAYGLIGTTTRAIRFAMLAPDDLATMATVIPFIVPVIVAYECHGLGRAIWGGILALSASAVLVFSARSPLLYGFGCYSLATAIPMLVLAGVAILWASRDQQKLSLIQQQRMMLIMCVTALCNLVQFPFSAPVYFFYVAPLVMLFAMALFASVARPPRFVLAVLICFYLLFAVLPPTSFQLGFRRSPDSQIVRLAIERAGGLLVESTDAHLYEALIPLVQSHATGKFIYAAPDCPEVYFFSGLKSPTRHFFDYAEEPLDHTTRILNALENLNVNVVTINHSPEFSSRLSPELQAALEERYPHFEKVGRFQVRWRE
jgi:hypothetical protein